MDGKYVFVEIREVSKLVIMGAGGHKKVSLWLQGRGVKSLFMSKGRRCSVKTRLYGERV